MKYLFVFFAVLLGFKTLAQDLNCRVEILSPQIQSAEKNRVFENLKKDIINFMNNRKWCEDRLAGPERIECALIMTISTWDGSSKYQATTQVQSTRPVFGSSFTTTVLNTNDKEWSFTYVEGQPLDYSETGINLELPSLLAFYANLIVGMDYDTFSLQGGTPYFLKAQNIINQSQSSSNTGWRAYDDIRNRYWIIENLLAPEMGTFREGIYIYHRKGLDQLSQSLDKGRSEIASIFPGLKESVSARPNTMLAQMFFQTKVDELVNIFTRSPDAQQKNTVSTALQDLDPSNGNKYQQIQ
jgi:hypothetical protein